MFFVISVEMLLFDRFIKYVCLKCFLCGNKDIKLFFIFLIENFFVLE